MGCVLGKIISKAQGSIHSKKAISLLAFDRASDASFFSVRKGFYFTQKVSTADIFTVCSRAAIAVPIRTGEVTWFNACFFMALGH